jgi:leucine dehydrogenase
MADHDHGEVHLCVDPDTRLRAIVAIHDERLGPALGGTRCLPYANEDAALTDALRLARAMTCKAALARLPHGGGKAVIVAPEGAFDRERLFARFARFVDGLGGRYITTEDSGTSETDMETVRRGTRHVCGFSVASGGSGDPSPFTALGVRRGIEACVALLLGRVDLADVRVAVQGVGHVGFALCRELIAAGARVTVADVVDELVDRVRDAVPVEVVSPAEIHRTECDVYAPCALGGALNDRTVPELRCRIVAGCANNQLANPRNGEMLHARGVLYAPDYAINAGGLINVAQEVRGYDAQEARARVLAIHDTVREICERSRAQDEPTHRVADAMVQQILAAATR